MTLETSLPRQLLKGDFHPTVYILVILFRVLSFLFPKRGFPCARNSHRQPTWKRPGWKALPPRSALLVTWDDVEQAIPILQVSASLLKARDELRDFSLLVLILCGSVPATPGGPVLQSCCGGRCPARGQHLAPGGGCFAEKSWKPA